MISVGERPNPGYELEVVEIGEERDEGAEITVRERWPLADRVYPQVVSYPSVLAEILGSVRVWLLQNGQRLPFE
ncbi:protease complex subunit PrcB family protein [Laceyella putida]|uniref:Protease complex subunit PrcB family protein n=1 Tax=Laceyella putida TaxID=110101 RepID=A0ABW2RJ21_9BACL